MALRLIAPPETEPLTVAEVRLQQRIDQDVEDELLAVWITAARQAAEHELGRALITQTWELTVDAFPLVEIKLAKPRLLAVESVKYVDAAGDLQTLDASLYTLDAESEPGYLLPARDTDWPDTLDVANAVRVRYSAGYGAAAADVPAAIRAWMHLRVGSLYRHRGEVATGVSIAALPYVDRLLDPFRVWEM